MKGKSLRLVLPLREPQTAAHMSDPEKLFENSELTTILVVSDMTAAKKFYLEKLGAELFREYGGNSTVINFLKHWILLVTEGGPTADKPGISFRPPASPMPISHSFTIRVDDCQKTYKSLLARGVEFITPPYDWGTELRCFFKDPDGHLWEISESKQA